MVAILGKLSGTSDQWKRSAMLVGQSESGEEACGVHVRGRLATQGRLAEDQAARAVKTP